jgi:oxygen-independent coproporphyrinogen-3 oxidase
MLEVDLWADAIGPHAGAAHLHFGGGSPNALSPDDFGKLVRRMADRFALRPGAEIAAELDPGMLSEAFIDAAGEAGVTRVSLGVQTFDPEVQAKVNRIQPFDMVAAANARLRRAGVSAINFDLMYGLPGQTPDNVAASTAAAVDLRPDRVAVFGYAHVPWMKKHQVMIKEADLADVDGRWAQAEAADETLRAAGYVRIGLDHYARPDDPLAAAAASGRLRRNFQGYTDDPAPVLVPIGPSSIGRFSEGFVQNAVTTDLWGRDVEAGRLPIARRLAVSAEDELRAEVIERLMCDLAVDVEAVCRARGFDPVTLDASLDAARALTPDGLCLVEDRRLTVPAQAHRLMRAVAACFDTRLPVARTRHARAV